MNEQRNEAVQPELDEELDVEGHRFKKGGALLEEDEDDVEGHRFKKGGA